MTKVKASQDIQAGLRHGQVIRGTNEDAEAFALRHKVELRGLYWGVQLPCKWKTADVRERDTASLRQYLAQDRQAAETARRDCTRLLEDGWREVDKGVLQSPDGKTQVEL